MTLDVECHRCGYAWKYTGSSEYYASCPQCKTSVPIEGGAGEESRAGTGGADPEEGPSGPDGDDLDVLATRIEELESTASGLHEAIEAMMARVTDLEKRHDAIATVGDGGTVADSGDDRPTATATRDADGAGREDHGGRGPHGAEEDAAGRSAPDHRETAQRGSADPTRPSAPSDGRANDARHRPRDDSSAERSDRGGGEHAPEPTPGGGAETAGGLEPIPDDEGNYDYLCPSCDGSLSGRPDVCLHCGASFDW